MYRGKLEGGRMGERCVEYECLIKGSLCFMATVCTCVCMFYWT